jgi:hypothetical protein
MLTSNSILYSIKNLLRNNNVELCSNNSFKLCNSDVFIHYRSFDSSVEKNNFGKHIFIVPYTCDNIFNFCDFAEYMIKNNVFFKYSFMDNDGKDLLFTQLLSGTIVFNIDIIAIAFFMLSRVEEVDSPNLDVHSRFPAKSSLAYKLCFLDRPIVDEFSLLLQSLIKSLFPGWEPKTSKFSIKLSHDIDTVRSVSFREICRDIVKRVNFFKITKKMQQYILKFNDPAILGCLKLAELSEKNGFKSAFYFMSAEKKTIYDNGYDIKSFITRNLITNLQFRGHEIGFHAGYDTMDDLIKFKRQKYCLDAVLKEVYYGGRQHYLRFKNPNTWRIWEKERMKYDSTLGYADHEGFRCGTCHPYHPYDIEKDRPMDILEIPLIVMDGTFVHYRGMTPEQAEEKILSLAYKCKKVNGIFTLLWHNTSLTGEWLPWFDMYKRILRQLSLLL